MRKMLNLLAYLVLTAGLLALSLMPSNTVYAATLTVNQTGNQTVSLNGDGTCSLIDAIRVANGSITDSDCGAGDGGSDTIVLTGGATYNITSSNNTTDGENGLPSITSEIIIDGNGASITRTGVSNYRIFHVAAAGNLTLNDIQISGSQSTSPGGGIFSQGTLTVNNSTIFNNVSTGNGGGLYVESGIVAITNSTLSGNSAASGGGLYVNGGTVSINAVTVANNGGGIVQAAGSVNVESTILDNNSTNCGGTVGNIGNNLSSDGTCAGFTTSSSLNLEGLNLNAPGLTPTHMLGAGSAAIDAAGSCSTFSDQRGVGRPVGTNCDIGSVEVGTPGFTIDESGGVAVDEEGATSDSYIVTVNTPPTADVEFTITADSQCQITSLNPVTVSSSTTGFTVDVQAIDDDIFETTPHTCVITHSATSPDPNYNGILIADVNANVADNDTPEVVIDPIAIAITEGGATATYEIVLATQPEDTVNILVDPDDECTVDTPAPQFNDLNWDTPQVVEVTAVNDLIDEGTHTCIITHSASSSDPAYDTITIDDVTATITDNDTAGVVVNPTTIPLAEGDPFETYTLTLDTPPADMISIAFAISPPGECTILSPDPLEIFEGETGPFTVEVIAVDDSIEEGAHSCTISHTATSSDAPYNSISIDDVTANITDNDTAGLAYDPNPRSITEGGPGQDYEIFLNTLPSDNVTINVTTDAQCTITAGNPATIPNGTLGPATVTVQAVDDTTLEASPHNCVITHTVSSPDTNYNFVDTNLAVEVMDDDGAAISIDDVTLAETNAGTVDFTFDVSLSAASAQTITVDWTTADNTATVADNDYETNSGTVTFAPGDTSEPVTVTVNGDTTFEGNEAFVINLTNPTNATIADNQGVGTITNDDTQPEINIDTPLALVEGNAGQAPITFTVSLTNASSQAITVTWQTTDNTAAAGSDYVAGGPTVLTFSPGAPLTQTVTVQVNGDTIDEPDETFFVNLSGATNATIDVDTGIGTITDDDPQPSITINDVSIAEGDTLTTDITFTVSLSNASNQAITVNWTTADGTATTADNDYNAVTTPTLITFNPGITTQPVTVQIVGDTTPEADETFFVNLATPTNASISDAQGTGTILDDDTAPLPTLSINDPPAVTEGTGATVDITFTVTLSAASAQTVTVNWSAADNTATASDYTATPALITFNPGDLTQTFTVQITGDTLDEAAETFFVNLATPTNATILDGQGIGTITDDDAAPTISIDDQTVDENDGIATFTVTLSTASGQTVTVNWTTADDTATAGSDYSATPTLITLNPGETTQTLNVTIIDDTIDEPPETFFVNLATPTNATILDGQGVGTITDDDPLPSIDIDPASTPEGDAGTTNLTFTLTLSNASSQAVTVNWTTADGSATVADNDYVAVTVPDTVTFTPNTTTQTVNVTINGDTAVEVDETLLVNLATPTNATIGTAQGTGTITNDDALPTLSIDDPLAIAEGNAGTTTINFTVTLSAASAQTVTVNWATADGTATIANSDYAATTGTLTFIPGDTSETIPVLVNGDLVFESNENFTVNLSVPVNATILDAQGTGTITNDDAAPPTISIDDPAAVVEGNAGTATINFTVTLSAASAQTVTVNWATADGSATAGSDYVTTTGTLTFIPGDTSETIPVTINGDTTAETNESFTVNLTTPVNATILDANGTGTITNDDATVSIGDVTVTEGNAGQVAANFSVTISAAIPQIVTVNWATANISATGGASVAAGVDYIAGSGTVTFPANSTAAQTVTVQVNGDTAVEPNETFAVNLSSPVNATIVDGQGVGTITNDDSAGAGVTITQSNGTTNVTEGGATDSYTVVLNTQPAGVVNIALTTSPSSQCTVNPTTLVFNPAITPLWNVAQTVTVTAVNDTAVENTHGCSIAHAATSTDGAYNGITINNVLVNITDNDTTTGTPTIRINDVTANEGNSGTTNFNFTLTRSGNVSGTSRVTATTADGIATVGNNDYESATQTFTFTAGQQSKTFTVRVVGDGTTEPNENFSVNLSNVTGATISDNQGIGTINNDDGTTPGTTPTATPIPAVPPVPLCADLNGTTNPIIRAQVPAGTVTNGNVFCRVLAQNGQFVGGSPPETVGNPQVLSLGVVHAVDVYALSGGSPIIAFNNPVTVCLQGTGSIVYLDATQAPRPPVILTGATSDGTYTCANIPNAGTVVLVQSGGNLPSANTGGGGSGGPSQNLSGCVITPSMRLNLRSVPGLDGRVLGIVPEGVALGSAQRTRRWFRVSFEGRTGWIFAAYVSNNGACGE